MKADKELLFQQLEIFDNDKIDDETHVINFIVQIFAMYSLAECQKDRILTYLLAKGGV